MKKSAKTVWGVLALVVQKVDNAIRRKHLYPLDSATGLSNTYPLDSDLSRTAVDSAVHLLNKVNLELSKLGSSGKCKNSSLAFPKAKAPLSNKETQLCDP